jgi:hypothetical protein
MAKFLDQTESFPAVAQTVAAAGHDLVAFQNSDLPASGLAEFVTKYFPRLRVAAHDNDLEATNDLGETQFIRRMPVLYHGGVIKLAGTQRFQTSALIALLDAGQGIERDFRQLVEQLALFNNRRA